MITRDHFMPIPRDSCGAALERSMRTEQTRTGPPQKNRKLLLVGVATVSTYTGTAIQNNKSSSVTEISPTRFELRSPSDHNRNKIHWTIAWHLLESFVKNLFRQIFLVTVLTS